MTGAGGTVTGPGEVAGTGSGQSGAECQVSDTSRLCAKILSELEQGARAGCPWRDLPEGFGNWKTVYNRHRRWSLDGTWEKILGGLRAGCDAAEGEDWTVSADSTVARAHQHAAGARRVRAADDSAGGFSE